MTDKDANNEEETLFWDSEIGCFEKKKRKKVENKSTEIM